MLRPLITAEAYFNEADELLEKGEVEEVSEERYNAVEDVKALAIRHRVCAVEGGYWNLRTMH